MTFRCGHAREGNTEPCKVRGKVYERCRLCRLMSRQPWRRLVEAVGRWRWVA